MKRKCFSSRRLRYLLTYVSDLFANNENYLKNFKSIYNQK